ncbi:MAG: hypothetical protein HY300_17505 [Verrucomicrobia bacterium]|nr:hypothetical protein [Verrucomicrobiota bacterium]
MKPVEITILKDFTETFDWFCPTNTKQKLSMGKKAFVGLFACAWIFNGCGSKPPPPPPPVVAKPPSAAEVPVTASEAPAPAPAPVPVVAAVVDTSPAGSFAKTGGHVLLDSNGSPVPVGPSPEEFATPEKLAAYNRVLQAWVYRTSALPDTMNDFKIFPGIPQPPKAPPGKRLVWNRAKVAVELAN